MRRDLTQGLAEWLAAGFDQIGEVQIRTVASGFDLRHHADAGRDDLMPHTGAELARFIANTDAAGAFRPLKTAPNLRRGWSLAVSDLAELRRALDYFYPAMLGVLLSHECGELPPVTLRETLARQSGMYAITQKITDAQAAELIGGFCRSDGGCLKTILWRIDAGRPITSLPEAKCDVSANQLGAPARALPMLCHEACNLLIAQARTVVKTAA